MNFGRGAQKNFLFFCPGTRPSTRFLNLSVWSKKAPGRIFRITFSVQPCTLEQFLKSWNLSSLLQFSSKWRLFHNVFYLSSIYSCWFIRVSFGFFATSCKVVFIFLGAMACCSCIGPLNQCWGGVGWWWCYSKNSIILYCRYIIWYRRIDCCVFNT